MSDSPFLYIAPHSARHNSEMVMLIAPMTIPAVASPDGRLLATARLRPKMPSTSATSDSGNASRNSIGISDRMVARMPSTSAATAMSLLRDVFERDDVLTLGRGLQAPTVATEL